MKRLKNMSLVIAGVVAVFFLSQAVLVYGLADEEMLRMLAERLAKGEISEKIYLELKAQYGKAGAKEAKPVAVKEVPGNLLKNASFELDADDDGMPDDWEKYQPQNADFGLDTEVFHSGKTSFWLSCEKLPRVVGITQTIKIGAGKKYHGSCWAKGEDLEVAFPGTEYMFFLFEYQWLDSDSKVISEEFLAVSDFQKFFSKTDPKISDRRNEYLKFNALKNLKDWVLLKDKVRTAPTNAVAVKVLLGMYRVNGTCWYDDIVFTEVE